MSGKGKKPKLGDYPIIRELLETLYREKLQYLRAMARRYGVLPGNEDDVIHETYMSLLDLEPRGIIQELLAGWQRTDANLARLDKSLIALFTFYLKFKCLDRLNNRPPDQPIDEVAGPSPFGQLDLQVTLAWLDRLVDRMTRSGELSQLESQYWNWRRTNPEGKTKDFAKHLDPLREPGGWITRAERSLFEKIALKVASDPPPRERQAETQAGVEKENYQGRTAIGMRYSHE